MIASLSPREIQLLRLEDSQHERSLATIARFPRHKVPHSDATVRMTALLADTSKPARVSGMLCQTHRCVNLATTSRREGTTAPAAPSED
jgi:hypothetical protein